MQETFSVCLLGDTGVGKTTLVSALSKDSPLYKAPINVCVSLYKDRTIEWWDFSGAKKHESLRGIFYKYFDGYVLVHDLSNARSYRNLQDWEKEIAPWLHDSYGCLSSVEFPLLLFGNKSDLVPGKGPCGSALSASVSDSAWTDFLDKVIFNPAKPEIKAANRNLESFSEEEDSPASLFSRIKSWWSPENLPLFKA